MIIWIASYPKSGNTWIRSMLSSYLFSKNGDFNFELLNNIEQFSSKNINNNINNDDRYQARVSKNWIPSQKIINKDNKIHFFKTHNAICSINGNNFTDKFNTLAAIYIVRDPRNLITSLSHHYELSLGESFRFLTNKKKIIFPKNLEKNEKEKKNNPNDFNFLSDWSSHYKSWKNINFSPVIIIKYEDIVLNTKKTFITILNFLSNFMKINLNDEKIDNVINNTTFERLSKLEIKAGFAESATSIKTNKKIRFFFKGGKNNWRKALDKKTIKKLENSFNDVMKELKYL